MKTKITFVLFFLITCFTVFSQPTPFIHYATSGNIDGETTEIDNPQINNDPNAIVMVEKVRIDNMGTTVNNPHFVGVRYNSISGKWYIHNENPSDAMVENSCYLVYTPPATLGQAFQHVADVASIVSGFPNTSQIDNGLINDNSGARCKCNRAYDSNEVQNNNPIEMFYNYMSPGNWYITTPTGINIPVNSVFNVMCNPAGFTVVQHESSSGNIDSEVNSVTDYAYWTILDDVLLNNNPNAWFFVNHRREPSTSTIYRSFSVFFNSVTGFWELHIELENYISGFTFPIGRFFDIFIWDGTLDIDEFETSKTLKLYPNPFKTKFTVKTKETINYVSIFNWLGQDIIEINGNRNKELEIDMSNYASGYYFAKVFTDNAVETIKLVKN